MFRREDEGLIPASHRQPSAASGVSLNWLLTQFWKGVESRAEAQGLRADSVTPADVVANMSDEWEALVPRHATADATVCVIHSWASSLQKLLATLRATFDGPRDTFIWLDFLCLPRGRAPRNAIDTTFEVLQAVTCRVLYVDESNAVLQDLWCLFQVWQTHQLHVTHTAERASEPGAPTGQVDTGALWSSQRSVSLHLPAFLSPPQSPARVAADVELKVIAHDLDERLYEVAASATKIDVASATTSRPELGPVVYEALRGISRQEACNSAIKHAIWTAVEQCARREAEDETNNAARCAHMLYALGFVLESKGKYAEAEKMHRAALDKCHVALQDLDCGADRACSFDAVARPGAPHVAAPVSSHSAPLSVSRCDSLPRDQSVPTIPLPHAPSRCSEPLPHATAFKLFTARVLFSLALTLFQQGEGVEQCEPQLDSRHLGNWFLQSADMVDARPCAAPRLRCMHGMMREAPQLLARAHSMVCKNHVDGCDLWLADIIEAQGRCQHSLGNLTESIALHRQAMTARSQRVSSNHLLMAHSHLNLGLVLSDMGATSEAAANIRTALRIYKASLGDLHHLLASAHCAFGRCLLKHGEPEAAAEQLRCALAIFRGLDGHEALSVAAVHADLSRCFPASAPDAMASASACLNIRARALHRAHPLVESALRQVLLVMRQGGQARDAQELERQWACSEQEVTACEQVEHVLAPAAAACGASVLRRSRRSSFSACDGEREQRATLQIQSSLKVLSFDAGHGLWHAPSSICTGVPVSMRIVRPGVQSHDRLRYLEAGLLSQITCCRDGSSRC